MGIRVVAKSPGSKVPVFTSLGALLTQWTAALKRLIFKIKKKKNREN
jgi:hypothetical protein